MKTPKIYTDLLKQNKITEEIIGEVLYSINKRAKNWRDQKKKLKYSVYENTYEKACEEEKKYYDMKDDILSIFSPVALHRDIKYRDVTTRIYNQYGYGDMTYKEYTYNDFNKGKYEGVEIRKFGSFFDRECYEHVEFVDIIIGREIVNELYFEYYKVGEFDFHLPTTKEAALKRKMTIIDLDNFTTEGKDINDLLSSQFCAKVHSKLVNNELEIVTL